MIHLPAGVPKGDVMMMEEFPSALKLPMAERPTALPAALELIWADRLMFPVNEAMVMSP
jgi:hypothetical protein